MVVTYSIVYVAGVNALATVDVGAEAASVWDPHRLFSRLLLPHRVLPVLKALHTTAL